MSQGVDCLQPYTLASCIILILIHRPAQSKWYDEHMRGLCLRVPLCLPDVPEGMDVGLTFG